MYRVDWIQFLAALVALASYSATIAACFMLYMPWPITVPLMTTSFIASGVWSHRRDLHEREGASHE